MWLFCSAFKNELIECTKNPSKVRITALNNTFILMRVFANFSQQYREHLFCTHANITWTGIYYPMYVCVSGARKDVFRKILNTNTTFYDSSGQLDPKKHLGPFETSTMEFFSHGAFSFLPFFQKGHHHIYMAVPNTPLASEDTWSELEINRKLDFS